MSSFELPQFLGQAGVDHDPRLCITLPVGSYFADRRVAHLESLPGAFDVAYNSASQSNFFLSIFSSVPISPIVEVGWFLYHLFYVYYQLCGYFISMCFFS